MPVVVAEDTGGEIAPTKVRSPVMQIMAITNSETNRRAVGKKGDVLVVFRLSPFMIDRPFLLLLSIAVVTLYLYCLNKTTNTTRFYQSLELCFLVDNVLLVFDLAYNSFWRRDPKTSCLVRFGSIFNRKILASAWVNYLSCSLVVVIYSYESILVRMKTITIENLRSVPCISLHSGRESFDRIHLLRKLKK